LSKQTIVVWFSCGAASAVAAKMTIEKYGSTHNIRVVNNPIKEEDPDNQRFLKDVEKWLGLTIEYCLHPKYPQASCQEIWEKRKYMSGLLGAPCTMILKKEARQHWETHNKYDYMVLGFTTDERHRHERFVLTERDNVIPVLIDAGITKQQCYKIILDAGLVLPRMYSLGYPNANCIGCVKATSPTYWNHVRRHHPDVFHEREALSRRLGCKLVQVKGQRIYLDELDPDAKGRPLKEMDFECGIFCEEQLNLFSNDDC
jgi:hypothetical protein